MVANRFKKKKKGIIRRFVGFMFYTKQFGRFKENFGTPWMRISNQIQSLINIRKPQYQKESFSDAINRLNLKDKDLLEIQKGYLRNAFFMFCMGVFLGIMGVKLVFDGLLAAGLVTQIFTFFCFSFSLYMHFWFFQIKNKKLGCTFNEWWNNKVN